MSFTSRALLVACIVLIFSQFVVARQFKHLQSLSEEARQLDAERLFQEHTLQGRVNELIKTHAPVPKPYVFIFVDAGSSGTRPKLFLIENGPTATEFAEAAEMSPLTSINPAALAGGADAADTFVAAMRTGLKAFYNTTAAYWAWKKPYGPATAFMTGKLPTYIDNLDVYIQSTAGMRTIPQVRAQGIYRELNALPHVKADTVSGRWEGFYGLYNAVSQPALFTGGWTMDNIVYVEIGGASIQVAFTVPLTRYTDVQNVHLEITSQIENEAEHPILLEVEGPMHLRSLPGLPFQRIYSQSFLGDAGDRMHARAIAKCIADGTKYDGPSHEYRCPCLARNAKLVDLANPAHDFTLAPASPSKVDKDRSSEGSRTCFATAVNRQFRQNSCKDYNIPAGLVTVAADRSIVGTANYAQCLATVQSIHNLDDDEMPAQTHFSTQWTHLLNALNAAHAQDKTKVLINSGALFFSSKMAPACVDRANPKVVNWATLQGCFQAADAFDGAPVGDRSFSLPSAHALGEDILTRLQLHLNNHDFKIINSGWLPAAAKITATALDLDDGDAKRLYVGADAFNAGPEDTPLDDHDWGTFWNGVHAVAGWVRSWFA